jgi:hypothetical protein
VNVVAEGSESNANLCCRNASAARNRNRIEKVADQLVDTGVYDQNVGGGGLQNGITEDADGAFSHDKLLFYPRAWGPVATTVVKELLGGKTVDDESGKGSGRFLSCRQEFLKVND